MNSQDLQGLSVEQWLEEEALVSDPYASYWNNNDIEVQKGMFCSTGGDVSRMERYGQESGLFRDFELCIEWLQARGRKPSGIGLDIAAGSLWMLPQYFRLLNISRITCVEYSRHRLLELGPAIISHYKLPKGQITLAFGSFYDLKTEPGTADFAILCQAFHHANDPFRLLQQVHRALRPGGIAIICGEHRMKWTLRDDILHPFYYIVSILAPFALRNYSGTGAPKHIIARSQDIFPPDETLGDHYYFPRDYKKIFLQCGFSLEFVPDSNNGFHSLVATKLTTTAVV